MEITAFLLSKVKTSTYASSPPAKILPLLSQDKCIEKTVCLVTFYFSSSIGLSSPYNGFHFISTGITKFLFKELLNVQFAVHH